MPFLIVAGLLYARAAAAPEVLCNLVTDYGIAIGPQDQTAEIRAAITDCRQRALAIDVCARAVVVFPASNVCNRTTCPMQENVEGESFFITGALNLTSNMTFRIETGATLLAIGSERLYHWPLVVQYAPYGDGTTPGWMPHEGSDNATWPNGTHTHGPSLSPFIGSEVGAENIVLEGGGVIDGNGFYWWTSAKLGDSGSYIPRHGGNGDDGMIPGGARAPRNIEPFMCKNLLIDNLTIKNPGDWNVHPFACDGVVIRNTTIYSPVTRGNTDGLDPDFCINVLVEDCTITSGDDAIAVKAGSGFAGGNADYAHAFEKRIGHGSENMIFRRTKINHRWPTIGSNCAGHIRNITFTDMVLGTHANQLGGLFIKTYSGNGGTIEDVTWENLEVYGKVGEWNSVPSAPIRVTMIYHTASECKLPCPRTGCICSGEKPRIKNIVFRNIRAYTTQNYPSKIRSATGPLTAGIFIGLPGSPIDGLTLDNVTVIDPNQGGKYGMVGWNCTNAINVMTKDVVPHWPPGTCTRPAGQDTVS